MTIEEIIMQLHEIKGYLDAYEYGLGVDDVGKYIGEAWNKVSVLVDEIKDGKELE
jgi:hypothetical protein